MAFGIVRQPVLTGQMPLHVTARSP